MVQELLSSVAKVHQNALPGVYYGKYPEQYEEYSREEKQEEYDPMSAGSRSEEYDPMSTGSKTEEYDPLAPSVLPIKRQKRLE